jgi:thiol-disulfide isomerase/thioredoxin
MEDVEIRRMYDRLRGALVAGASEDRVVTAAAQPAQNFALKDLSGKTVKLSDYRGKVVLVTFFATWCGPCKLEMPQLKKFRDEHRAKGVEVLAINTDDFNQRSRVAPFVAEANLDMPVLFEDPAQLTSYDYSGIPALYVIDRAGNVVHARTGYDPHLKEQLEHEITAVVEGKGDGGRKLATIEHAPAGWGVLWQRPIRGDLSAAAIASPLGGAGGEVGVIGREGLMRWSATGHALPSTAIAGYTMKLDATDLDGDGQREWIVAGWQDIKVLDHTGELYWQHAGKGWTSIAGRRDFDGDGFQELVLRDGDRAVMMKAVPEPVWTSAPFTELEAVHVDPAGGLVLQADREIFEIDARGTITARGKHAPEGRELAGRMVTRDGVVDLYRGMWDPAPQTGQDLDGDGHADVLIANNTGMVVYDTQGQPLLRVRSHDLELHAALGDLDGEPGAELALLIKHYGLVVLGKRD